MDKDTIAILENLAKKIDDILSELEHEFNNTNYKDDDFSKIEKTLKNISLKLETMKTQISFLKDENKKFWEKKRKEFSSKYEDFNEQFNNLKNQKIENTDPENIERSFDHNRATVEEEYKRGKKILNEDNRILGELIDIVSKDGETLMIVKQKLKEQQDKLEMLPFDEMQYSLKRAGAKIKNMMKMALSDNIAKCLIAVISIIILTIIIVSFLEGKKDNNYNLPFDIFSSNKNAINIDNNTTSSYSYSFCLVNKFYITIFIIVLLIL